MSPALEGSGVTRSEAVSPTVAVSIDLLMMLLAPWLMAALAHAYTLEHWTVGLIPLCAFVGFCAVLWLVRRLPGDVGGSHTSRWAFASVMVGTCLLLFAIPWVMGEGAVPVGHFMSGTTLGLILTVPLGLVLCVAVFLPLGLLLVDTLPPMRRRVGLAEVCVLVVSDLISIVGASLFELPMATAPLQGEPHPNVLPWYDRHGAPFFVGLRGTPVAAPSKALFLVGCRKPGVVHRVVSRR